jgi:hypothetical protein
VAVWSLGDVESGMEFKKRTLKQIADMICGYSIEGGNYFRYRSSSFLTEFFEDCGTDFGMTVLGASGFPTCWREFSKSHR